MPAGALAIRPGVAVAAPQLGNGQQPQRLVARGACGRPKRTSMGTAVRVNAINSDSGRPRAGTEAWKPLGSVAGTASGTGLTAFPSLCALPRTEASRERADA